MTAQDKGRAGIEEIEKVLAHIAEDGEFDYLAQTWIKLGDEEKYAIGYYTYGIYQELRRRRGWLGLSIVGVLELLAKLGIWMNERAYYFDRLEAECKTQSDMSLSSQTPSLDASAMVG